MNKEFLKQFAIRLYLIILPIGGFLVTREFGEKFQYTINTINIIKTNQFIVLLGIDIFLGLFAFALLYVWILFVLYGIKEIKLNKGVLE